MGSGEWGMGSGEWGMGNGEWGMGSKELLSITQYSLVKDFFSLRPLRPWRFVKKRIDL
ncbi:hypothetical protein NIES4072_17120 [Nostoc commune NIES-4072]|uniref:Uncharacterized protein n=2 Tax=Nostoc commune TaxID=1178 RepID=A0A2R5FKT0_NOSCO|nr:hypothetical protein NIES4070_09690 [Nostoc commune HK-02]GBG18048.1 hypothetical protein NIES4072_17120 [Nostoc commune NIES-4072]